MGASYERGLDERYVRVKLMMVKRWPPHNVADGIQWGIEYAVKSFMQHPMLLLWYQQKGHSVATAAAVVEVEANTQKQPGLDLLFGCEQLLLGACYSLSAITHACGLHLLLLLSYCCFLLLLCVCRSLLLPLMLTGVFCAVCMPDSKLSATAIICFLLFSSAFLCCCCCLLLL